MKKLLALMLVLGLASAASAVVSISSDMAAIDWVAGDVATVTVSADPGNNYGGWIAISGPGAFGDLTILPAAGANASKDDTYLAADGWWGFEAKSFDPANPVPAGDHFTVPVTGSEDGMITVDLYDFEGANILDSVQIESIPEPMTMGLLGLGGLFLRRRK